MDYAQVWIVQITVKDVKNLALVQSDKPHSCKILK